MIDDVTRKDLLAKTRHLEYLRSPVDADKYREDCQYRHYGATEEVVEPRFIDEISSFYTFHQGKTLVFLGSIRFKMCNQIACLVLLREVVDEGNRHDGSQLERPPNHYLHGKQRVTNPGSNASEEHRSGGDVRVNLVE